MTAIMIASIGSAALTAAALETTVTVQSEHWFDDGTEDSYFAFGFNDTLADPNGLGLAGSISVDNYLDGSSTTRTINSVYYTEDTGGLASSNEDSIWFGLVGVSIPNTNVTFRELEYNGVTYVRTAATYTANVSGQTTFWQWSNVSPNGPTSGVRDFNVLL